MTYPPTPEREAEIRDMSARHIEAEKLDGRELLVKGGSQAIRDLLALLDASRAETAKAVGDSRKATCDDLRKLLRERSKGEVETWGFVAAFMGMIDEVEKSQ